MCNKMHGLLKPNIHLSMEDKQAHSNSHLLQASGMLPGWQTFSRLCFSSYIMEVCRFPTNAVRFGKLFL